MKCSLFKSVVSKIPERDIDFGDYMNAVSNGEWEGSVNKYRALLDMSPDKASQLKIVGMPAITPSGTFSERTLEGMIDHSGIICIDVDFKDNEHINLDEAVHKLSNNEYVLAVHRSVSGLGLSIYFKIDGDMHLPAFKKISEMLKRTYGIISDKNCPDVTRLRIVSYDPNAYYNKNAIEWYDYNVYVKPTFRTKKVYNNEHLNELIDIVERSGVDITRDYRDWTLIAFALVTELGEDGMEAFLRLSQFHPEFDEDACIKKYENALKSSRSTVTAKTIFFIAREHGIDIKGIDYDKHESKIDLIREIFFHKRYK